MPFPLFKNGALLFCNGKPALTCCEKILTVTATLSGNSGVYNVVSFVFAGDEWGNTCGALGNGNGYSKAAWSGTFDIRVLGENLTVTVRADCHRWDSGDTVGVILIHAEYGTQSVDKSLTPSPVTNAADDTAAGWTPGCPSAGAASATVSLTNGVLA